jgi:hypothetical protein
MGNFKNVANSVESVYQNVKGSGIWTIGKEKPIKAKSGTLKIEKKLSRI